MNPVYFNYIALPLLIFIARIADVSIGTIRIIFVNRGQKHLAPILGFFEVLIWIIAISKLMESITHFWLYVVYALGFAAGTYIGIVIDEKFSTGKVMVNVILKEDGLKLIKNLEDKGYLITTSKARSEAEKKNVHVIFSVINKSKIEDFLKILRSTNPKAFYTIEDVRNARESPHHRGNFKRLSSIRKIK